MEKLNHHKEIDKIQQRVQLDIASKEAVHNMYKFKDQPRPSAKSASVF